MESDDSSDPSEPKGRIDRQFIILKLIELFDPMALLKEKKKNSAALPTVKKKLVQLYGKRNVKAK